MTLIQHLLLQLGEEGSEIQQATSKSIRFGLCDIYTHISEDGKETVKKEMGDNRHRLVGELNDLLALAEMLVNLGVLPENWESDDLKDQKKAKVLRYLRYSRKVGTLDQPLGKEMSAIGLLLYDE